MFVERNKRIRNYRKMVSDYYSIITDLYIKFWGQHFHAAFWTNKNDTMKSALDKTHKMFINDAKITSHSKVLDVGCGIGALSFLIAKKTHSNVIGLNISEYQLKKANNIKNKLGVRNVEFKNIDIIKPIGLPKGFDAAFLIDVGCHLPDKEKALRNIYNSLKDGSRLIIADWLQKEKPNLFEREVLLEPFNQLWALPYLISFNEYIKILRKIGFRIIKAKDVSKYTKKTWQEFYNITLKVVNDLTLSKMLSFVKNPKIILKYRGKALKVIKNQVYANLFTKICSDAGVFRYGYFVVEK